MSTIKGPWQYKATHGDCWTVHDCEGTAIMGDAQYYPWVPGEADQWRLIAAAPELLEALEAYDAWTDKTFCTEPELKAIRNQIRAAINKATGKAP